MKNPPVKTKIIATLGPASSSYSVIKKLLKTGVRVFRLNFSHGDHKTHLQTLNTIREVSKHEDIHAAVIADLQGPKIRTGETLGGRTVWLSRGKTVSVTPKRSLCTEENIFINYRNLIKDVKRGDLILINDGAVRLKAEYNDAQTKRIKCRVMNSGTYSSHKGVNFPGVKLSAESLTAKDRKDLEFILNHDIDYIALSFVRSAKELKALRRIISSKKREVKVIAKIEKPEAVNNIDSILESCDGIMVARGDLGVETSLFRVPVIQKKLISKANQRGKITIVATQMLESMITKPFPTRAETADVSNAIIDGSDAVMLSAETAVGSYPVKAVSTMVSIAGATEKSEYFNVDFTNLTLRKNYPPHAVCEAAVWAGKDLGNIPLIVCSWHGESALYLSKLNTISPVFAFTPDAAVAKRLCLAKNITPFVVEQSDDIVSLIKGCEEMLMRRKILQKGRLVVVVSGRIAVSGGTAIMQIKRMGEGS